MTRALRVTLLILAGMSSVSLAQTPPASTTVSLPERLSLETAYEWVKDIPELMRLEALHQRMQAQRQSRAAESAWTARMEAQLARREFKDREEDNHSLYVQVNKPLYRFGREQANQAINEADAQWMQTQKAWHQQEYKLQILEDYFAVLEADLAERVAVEEMAIAFVTYDKFVERHRLGEVSDAQLVEQENLYQPFSLAYSKAQFNQRMTRENLALTLGYPGKLSTELVAPDFSSYVTRLEQLPEQPHAWIEQAMGRHPRLALLEREIAIQKAHINRLETNHRPHLDLVARVGDQSHREDREGRWMLGLQLRMPLHDGGQIQAQTALIRAEIARLEVEKKLLSRALYQQVFERWNRLKILRATLRAEDVLVNFTERNMMRNRAFYEQEWASDLGDAMVQMSKTAFTQAQTRIQIAKVFEELDLMQGVTK